MLILMENAAHGRMHVYSNAEVESAQKHGWTIVADAPVAQDVAIKPEIKIKKVGK